MKFSTIAGIVLIIVGVLALAYEGYVYKHPELEEQLVHETEETRLLSPVFGVVILAGGVILTIFGRRSRNKK